GAANRWRHRAFPAQWCQRRDRQCASVPRPGGRARPRRPEESHVNGIKRSVESRHSAIARSVIDDLDRLPSLRLLRRMLCVALLAKLSSADAQPPVRRAANLAAVVTYTDFYHARPIVLVGTVGVNPNGDLEVADGTNAVHLVTKVYAPDGLDEIRGEFWDLGRM